MKNIKRKVCSVICVMLCSALLLLGAGCGEKTAALLRFNMPEQFDQYKTSCVAENNRYSLIWDAKEKRVVLYDRIKDCEWSYVPYESLNSSYNEEGDEATVHPRVKSPIIVNYYATSTLIDNETNAAAQSISKGTYTMKPITNGVEITYYFEKFEFTVPVSFVLREDGVDISVDPNRIEENSEYCISSVVIAPFFCSVSNNNAGKDGHYIFYPSGSGTLLYPTYTGDEGTVSSESVFGEDLNIEKQELLTPTETIRMPVYGVVNGDRGVCAIIKSGAESAYLNTRIGHRLTGYSYVAAEFKIRGYQEAIQTLFTTSVVKTNIYANGFSPDILTVGFYPLYDEEASYANMANVYRNYLKDSGSFSKKGSDDRLLNLKVIGGIETKKFNFGVPSTAMLTATTVNQAKDMVSELKNLTGVDMNVNLVGFGQSGNDIGVVAGNYKLNKAFGSKKDMQALAALCESQGTNLYMNFDMVRFSAAGGGLSSAFGKATSTTGSFTTKNYYSINFRTPNTTLRSYYLASRSKFDEIAEKIDAGASKLGLSGVSLDTLTSLVYSDYSDRAFYAGANFGNQVTNVIDTFRENGYKVAGSDANYYAAANCDHVYDVPTSSSKYRSYSVDVPFYEMVFKGYVSMSGTSLNLATNKNTALLKAVESGSGLQYTLVGEYNTQLITSAQNVFYGALYWDEAIERGVRTDIVDTVGAYKDYFEQVKNAEIIDHKVINDNVRLTVFDNGVSVYVNYGDKDYAAAEGAVTAGGYLVVKGA